MRITHKQLTIIAVLMLILGTILAIYAIIVVFELLPQELPPTEPFEYSKE